MSRKKKKSNILIIFSILILIAIIGVSAFLFRDKWMPTGGIYTKEIWLPRYYTGECIPRADNMYPIAISSHTDTATWYHCNTAEAGKYIPPNVNGIYCRYIIDDISNANVYVCNGYTTNNPDLSTSKCVKKAGTWSMTGDHLEFIVNSGDSININTDKIIGYAKLTVEYPSYGIQWESPDGYTTSTSSGCLVNALDNKYHTIDLGSRIQIVPDVPVNSVVGLSKAISTQVVTIDGINNNKPIYIQHKGYYQKISKSEDGFEYVDTALGEFADSRIQCVPRTIGCSDDAIFTDIINQNCDIYGGAITGYAPVQGDDSRLCKYSCTNGKLSLTNDCISITTCPSDKPIWNTETGQCERIEDIEPPITETPILMYILIGLGVILIILVIVLIVRNQQSQGGTF